MHFSKQGIVAAVITLVFVGSIAFAQEHRVVAQEKQVLFVCEHGNVKSLMAMTYFNRLAQERGLPFRAVSRGTAPDSTTVPPKVMEALKGDGFNVSAFHPVAVKAADVSTSQQVITMGVDLPKEAESSKSKTERWDDVPPASVDFGAARDSIMAHVRKLIDQLAKP